MSKFPTPKNERPEDEFRRLMEGSTQTHAPYKLEPEIAEAILQNHSDYTEVVNQIARGEVNAEALRRLEQITVERASIDTKVESIIKLVDELTEDKTLQAELKKAARKYEGETFGTSTSLMDKIKIERVTKDKPRDII